MKLDGETSIVEISSGNGACLSQLENFIEILHDRCVVEPMELRQAINDSQFYRLLNFLGDYFPAEEVFGAFDKVRSAKVAVLGCGAVGSWTSLQLAHSGFQHFILIDSDIVEESNLNRSLFLAEDLELPKVQALTKAIHRVSPDCTVSRVQKKISMASSLSTVLTEAAPDIVVNCADEPSVDVTSEWINQYCQEHGVPYVIAGGYNLHLSLIGMTVRPGVSACYNCSRLTLDELEDTSLRGVKRLWRPKRNLGSLAPLAGVTSSLAASEILRLAVQSERLVPAMQNRRGEFNFLTNELSYVSLPPRPECGCIELARKTG
ncbi:ThiF family adenylyltransferase [Ruegeria sp. HU-ET01832]|uniref:HesA/MoeB/ThiF family protein n=1 Tax=Ruegeria sp. HU-ET01832 TaxID=3135906 RepID=UPI003342803A